MPRKKIRKSSIDHVATDETRRMVTTLIANGTKHDVVAEVMQVSTRKLASVYAAEIRVASAKANSNVAQSLYQKAMSNGPSSVTAAIFWLKCRAQWKEPAQEIGGVNGGPIPIQIVKEDTAL